MLVSFTVTIHLAGSLGKLFDLHFWKAICPAFLEGYLAGSLGKLFDWHFWKAIEPMVSEGYWAGS